MQERPLTNTQLLTPTAARKTVSGALPAPAVALNDTDVLKVRSLPNAPNNNASTAANAAHTASAPVATAPSGSMQSLGAMPLGTVTSPEVGAQSFLQQRQLGTDSPLVDKKVELANAINKALTQTKLQAPNVANANTATTYASITLGPALVQQLDRLTGLPATVTKAPKSLEPQTLGSFTGASFKAAAPLTHMPTMATSLPTADVSTMDLGQRFSSLMQGDSPAQMAARQMQDQVGQQLQRMVKEGRWQANLSLNPAHLGKVSINLVMEDGVLQTQLLSGNAGVRELLESSLPRLREQLEDGGLQLAGVSVGSDHPGQQKSSGDEPDWQLSQTVKSTNEDRLPEGTTNSGRGHEGDLDTFA